MTRGLLLLLSACMPSVTPDKAATPRGVDTAVLPDTGQAPMVQRIAALSTLASDYSVGAVATVDLDTLALSDTLTPTSGDAVVRAVDGQVAVLNRLNTDTLRLYSPGAWVAPELELALPDLSNPQDAAWCGDKLWVSLHSADHLPAYNMSGRRVARADLSPWAGSDGSAEATGIEVYDGSLYVALEQFAQDAGWESEGGVVVRVDCETAEVALVLEAAPSPSISAGPRAGTVVVRTGLYGELDGAVSVLDLETGEAESWLTESELGVDITAAAAGASGLVYLTADADFRYAAGCLSGPGGVPSTGLSTDSFLTDVAVDDRGRAWVTARQGWSSEGSEAPGLHVLSADTCQPLITSPIRSILDPYTVSFL